jgi:myo-inositol 2-dehydrogenase / D-chiro-inositol 1-dehydrogenase
MPAASRKRLRVGLVGCGGAARKLHLPALRSVAGVEVVALADMDAAALADVAGRFGVERRYTDAHALIDDRDVDAVAVCVPARAHAEVGVAALEAGKHLLVEKPLALSLDDCDALIDAAAGAPGHAMVAFNWRFDPLVRRALQAVRAGRLGAPVALRTALTDGKSGYVDAPPWRGVRDLGGGALVEKAGHHFDLWRSLLGSEVVEVSAMSRSTDRWDDEIAVVTARMASGAFASSVFAESTSRTNELAVYGRAGHLVLSPFDFDGLSIRNGSELAGTARARLRGLARSARSLPRLPATRPRRGEYLASYRGEWRHFVDCVRSGSAPECGLVDGRRALEVSLAAIESAERGAPVALSGVAQGA